MKEEKRKILTQVAYMHFVEGKSQGVIAEELGIYRTTISRMLKQAKAEGLVEIRIKDFDSKIYALESHLRKQYGLKLIRIVPTIAGESTERKRENLAKEAASFLKERIEPQSVVGVSWGSTLADTISKIENRRSTEATFVPIVGGPSHINSQYHVNTLVYELARKFTGNSLFVNATVVQESKRLKEGIVQSKYFAELKDYWQKLDLAIVGIGGSLYAKESQWRDLLTDADYEDLKLREAVGDCCCRFFDQEGKILRGSLHDRTIGLELEELQQVPLVVGIAQSKQKSRAILAMLKKSYINALVSDEETIVEMLRLAKDPFMQKYEALKV